MKQFPWICALITFAATSGSTVSAQASKAPVLKFGDETKFEIKHHVHEEEMPSEGMFAQCRKTDVDLVELRDRMLTRKTELLATAKSGGLPRPIVPWRRRDALPRPFRGQLQRLPSCHYPRWFPIEWIRMKKKKS